MPIISDEEHLLFDKIREQQIKTVDHRLHRLGYDGSFAEPYNPLLDGSIGTHNEHEVKSIFENLPKILTVELAYYSDETQLILNVSRPVKSEAGIRTVIASCTGAGRRGLYLRGRLPSSPSTTIIVPFIAGTDVTPIFRGFGFEAPEEDPVEAPAEEVEYPEEDEEIEIELPDNPLDIDFPKPTD